MTSEPVQMPDFPLDEWRLQQVQTHTESHPNHICNGSLTIRSECNGVARFTPPLITGNYKHRLFASPSSRDVDSELTSTVNWQSRRVLRQTCFLNDLRYVRCKWTNPVSDLQTPAIQTPQEPTIKTLCPVYTSYYKMVWFIWSLEGWGRHILVYTWCLISYFVYFLTIFLIPLKGEYMLELFLIFRTNTGK